MRVGWASPVQFDLRNFKYPRLYSIISAVAGLISNFMLSLLSFFLLKYVCILHLSVPITRVFQNIFLASAEVNAMLGTFNILPIPPLDGSSVLFAALYKRFPLIAVWLYRYALLILIMLLLIPMTRGVLIQVILDVSNYIGGLFFVDYRVEVGSFFF
jgi:Zn-dependent protease